jgi:hypothetical protein
MVPTNPGAKFAHDRRLKRPWDIGEKHLWSPLNAIVVFIFPHEKENVAELLRAKLNTPGQRYRLWCLSRIPCRLGRPIEVQREGRAFYAGE